MLVLLFPRVWSVCDPVWGHPGGAPDQADDTWQRRHGGLAVSPQRLGKVLHSCPRSGGTVGRSLLINLQGGVPLCVSLLTSWYCAQHSFVFLHSDALFSK